MVRAAFVSCLFFAACATGPRNPGESCTIDRECARDLYCSSGVCLARATLTGDEPPPEIPPVVVTVTPPDTVLSKVPVSPTSAAGATFEFSSASGDAFACTLNGGSPYPCTSPHTPAVINGPNTFTVAASLTGVTDATPATHSFVVDAMPPETTVVATSPAITNRPTVSVSFSSPTDASATFECALDAASFAGCSSPMTLTPGLGAHTFSVRAIDPLANVDASPATLSLTLGDATSPLVRYPFDSAAPLANVGMLPGLSLVEGAFNGSYVTYAGNTARITNGVSNSPPFDVSFIAPPG